jgi:small-conductance mechanosensitive channel
MLDTLPQGLISFIKAGAVFAGVTGLALGLRHVAFRALHRWAAGTATQLDDILLQSVRVPSIAWCILIGLYIAVDTMHLPPRPSALALNVVFGLLVVSVTAAFATLTGSTLSYVLKENNLALPATGLSLAIIKIVIWLTGGLVLLSGLGVSIAPILTALGVGGLAVALALQDTLSNFFAGIHLLIEKPVRVGDFVRLETGQEGYVADIGWRTTRIRMLPNNMVIIPNNKLTQSILTNYSLPEPRMAVSIPFGVSYDANPELVERVVLEEAKKAVGQVPGLLADPAPAIRLIPGFGESSLNFTLGVHVREFEDQFPVQHELRKRLLKRFQEEKIQIPFPQQTVHLKTDKPS